MIRADQVTAGMGVTVPGSWLHCDLAGLDCALKVDAICLERWPGWVALHDTYTDTWVGLRPDDRVKATGPKSHDGG